MSSDARADAAPLRIAMTIETDGPGGAEVVFIQLSEELRARGHTVIAVGPEKGRGWLSGQLRELGFERRTFRLSRPVDPGCVLRMRRMLAELSVDVVHSHEFTMAVYGTAAARLLGLRHVVTMHGADRVFDARRRRIALRLALAGSHAMVGVSDHTSRYMAAQLRVPVDRIPTVPNGIPVRPGDRERVRRELGLSEHDVLIVTVGNLRPRKGHIVLLRALARLAQLGVGGNAHVAIAGEGAEAAVLQRFASENGLEKRVHLLGLRRDIPDLQAAADVSAMPSFWEGLPLAVLEGMFAGNPIVASRVGGIPEVITPGIEGFLSEPGDDAGLADALAPLIEDPLLRARMGEAACARAQRDYRVERMADRYLRLYRGEPDVDPPR